MALRSKAAVERRLVILFANTDWYLYNFQRSFALALRETGHDVLLLSPAGPYGPRLQVAGLRWRPVPMERRSLNPLRELILIAHLARLFRRERPALVHGFTIKSALYGSLAAQLAGVRARIGTVCGMGYAFANHGLKARSLRPVVRALIRLAFNDRRSRVIVQNPDDAELFERACLVESDRVRVIPGSGVDPSSFRHAARMRTAGDSMTVLLAARLLWEKGLAEYVAAARRLKDEERPIRFLVAGRPDPGNPGSVPEVMLRRWVEAGPIEWLGHVEDMPSLLASVDAVVLPSYREGLPKTLVEAAACALPLIASDIAGCRQVVEHERSGLLVPVRDADALATSIARLHDDPGLARRLGEVARERVLARYDVRLVIERTMAVYREVIDARGLADGGGRRGAVGGPRSPRGAGEAALASPTPSVDGSAA